MYSKYLEYTDAATKSHHSAQSQNEQKDIIISQLKGDIYQLKKLQSDFLKLNDLIAVLESKYSLMLCEKDRTDKEQKIKSDIDRKGIIELREDIDDLRVHLQKANLQIQDLLRENTNIKRQCDGRSSDIQQTRYQIKQIDNKNGRCNDENRSLAITVKGLKQQRKRLENECDGLSSLLDSNMNKLKNVDKQVRGIESINARLEKTLYQAEKDNNKLVVELKDRNEEAKKGQHKLKGMNNSIKELQMSYRNIEQQSNKNKTELDKHLNTLNSQVAKGKQLQNKIVAVEASIKVQQNELDIIINEEEKQRKQHFSTLEKNKYLNTQIDQYLHLIAQYEQVNRQLIDQIEIYIDQDEQALHMLTRRDVMKDIIESTARRMAATEQPIRHLKC